MDKSRVDRRYKVDSIDMGQVSGTNGSVMDVATLILTFRAGIVETVEKEDIILTDKI